MTDLAVAYETIRVNPAGIAVSMFERSGDDRVGHILADEDVVRMSESGIEFSLAELHEGMDVPSEESEGLPDAP